MSEQNTTPQPENKTDAQASEQAQNVAVTKKRVGIIRKFMWLNAILGFIFLPVAAVLFYAITIYPTLPDPAELKDVSYQVPLKIVTEDGKLISEIGIKKREPLDYHEIPEKMTHAIISSEDENFFEHGGVDYKGLGRAIFELISTGEKQSGGSTITMQVARNFYLSKEKTYLRKLNEIILAYKIEHELSKQEILALYLNKIFLGYRSYGIAAAAKTYYGKEIKDLSLDEFAMIAGLPKAPSAFNPIANPSRAQLRRNYVLRRMNELNFITREEMIAAQAVEVHAKLTGPIIDVEAGYVAEMARRFIVEQYGDDALQNGYTIVTTINSELQARANQAVRDGLQEYERRHGYRGPIQKLTLAEFADTEATLKLLEDIPNYGGLKVAAVTSVTDESALLLIENNQTTTLTFEQIEWAAPYVDVNTVGNRPKVVQDVLNVGDVVYLQWLDNQWQLAQDPKTEAALVSIDSHNGEIQALVGGFDYFRSKFNRVTQGRRQVGSNIKPFLYSAALDKGMTAATTINDAPVVFHDKNLEDLWRPENYSGRFYGPTRLRKALAHSRNLVSIRLLRQLGINNTIEYFQPFGFPLGEMEQHRDLSLSLGSVQFTPLDLVTGYATFANTGYKISPFIIKEVRDYNGDIIYQATPKRACINNQCVMGDEQNAERIIDTQNAYIMTSMLQDVIRIGSGRKAKKLKREDIAGKTGTTNDQKDAWFSGYNPNIVTTVWAGFDQPSTLGRYEVGGRAALPIWMNYMEFALRNEPNLPFEMPEGLVNIPIDPETGDAVPPETPGALYEVFRQEYAPDVPNITQKQIETITEELFE